MTHKRSIFGGVNMNCEIQQKEMVKKPNEGEEGKKSDDLGKNKNN